MTEYKKIPITSVHGVPSRTGEKAPRLASTRLILPWSFLPPVQSRTVAPPQLSSGQGGTGVPCAFLAGEDG